MGAPPRRPSPSPLQLLAIIEAKGRGISAQEIRRRTHHSAMSVYRWQKEYGHESAFLEELVRKHGIDMTGYRFEDLYPKQDMDIPTPESAARASFQTAMGNR